MSNPNPNFLDSWLEKMLGSFYHHFIDGLFDEKNEKAKLIAGTLLCAMIILFTGVEFVKVVFRRNFGKHGLNSIKLALVVFALIVIAISGFAGYLEPMDKELFLNERIALYTGILYSLLALFTIVRGFQEKVFNKKLQAINPFYRGDSLLLNFLIKDGWSAARVQNLAEPIILLAIGMFLLPYGLFLGLPFMLFSCSYYIHLGIETAAAYLPKRNEMANSGYQFSQESTYAEVIN